METESIPPKQAYIYEVPNPGGFVSQMLIEGFTYQSSSRYRCPTCQVPFKTHDALIQHINSCHSSFSWPSLTTQDSHPPSYGRSNSRAKYHERSGYTFSREPSTFEKMNSGPFKQEREINLYYPFRSRAEWSLAKFLVDNLTQAQINKFLALPWVFFFLFSQLTHISLTSVVVS